MNFIKDIRQNILNQLFNQLFKKFIIITSSYSNFINHKQLLYFSNLDIHFLIFETQHYNFLKLFLSPHLYIYLLLIISAPILAILIYNIYHIIFMDIIVIGAGISGIKAAAELSQRGYSVLIVQADNHIGGRISTRPVDLFSGQKFMFDIGASWIHQSCKVHPITKLAEETNTKLVHTDFEKIDNFELDGEIIKQEIITQAWEEYQKISQQISSSKTETTIYEGIKEIDPEKLTDKYFMLQVNTDIEFQTSSSIVDLSGWEALNDNEFQGKQMIVTSGYQRMCEYLVSKYKLNVLLGHEVVRIKRQEGQNVVFCKNGKVLQCRKVVISVPLGVLKKNKIEFIPPLPSRKIKAVNKLGFGNVCKIFIAFQKPIVDLENTFFSFANQNMDQLGVLNFWINFNYLIGKPAFMTFGLGQGADIVQNMSDADLRDLIYERLSLVAAEKFQKNSFRFSRTSWRNNPNSYGAYSYARLGCTAKQYKQLARPVFENEWYFCGQHTSSRFRASVHGAFLSGQHVSKIIINGDNDENWRYFDEKKTNKKQSSSESESEQEK